MALAHVTFSDIPPHVFVPFVQADVEVWRTYCRLSKDQYHVAKVFTQPVFESLADHLANILECEFHSNDMRDKVFRCFKLNMLMRLLDSELTLDMLKALTGGSGKALFTDTAFSRRAPDVGVFRVIKALLRKLSENIKSRTRFVARIAVSYAAIGLFKHMMNNRKYCYTLTRPSLCPTHRMLTEVYFMCSIHGDRVYIKQAGTVLAKYVMSNIKRIRQAFKESYPMRDELITYRKQAYKNYTRVLEVT
jgi:hypothetical protein